MATYKLTKAWLDKHKASGPNDDFAWDPRLPRFGARAKPSGVKTFVYQYHAGGKTPRKSIGQYGKPWTMAGARRQAAKLLMEVDAGGDPVERMRAERSAAKTATVADLAGRYMAEIAEPTKKKRSVEEDQRNLNLHILPALGSKKVAAVKRQHVEALMHDMRGKPAVANRSKALISHMYTKAPSLRMLDDPYNPCIGVEKFVVAGRERYLKNDELSRLGTAVSEVEAKRPDLAPAMAAIRLLIFTGCRRNEILDLKWEHVDVEAACLRLPDSKTGAKVVHLPAPALEVLSNIERVEGNAYVIVGRKSGARLVGLNHIWARVRERADLEDVRLHDLRHSYASTAVNLNIGLQIIGNLLGHKQASTTEKYAHVDDDPAKAAAERIGAAIVGAMFSGKTAEVHKLGKG